MRTLRGLGGLVAWLAATGMVHGQTWMSKDIGVAGISGASDLSSMGVKPNSLVALSWNSPTDSPKIGSFPGDRNLFAGSSRSIPNPANGRCPIGVITGESLTPGTRNAIILVSDGNGMSASVSASLAS